MTCILSPRARLAPNRLRYAGLLLTIFLIAGCAGLTKAPGQNGTENASASPAAVLQTQWSGRLALKIDSQPPQSFSAAFELNGSVQQGSLTLSTPLGSTLALLAWTPQNATLKSPRENQQFASVDALVAHVTGTNIPAQALFDWLQGKNTANAGWQADLSQHASGRIVARQTRPPQPAELRIVLDR